MRFMNKIIFLFSLIIILNLKPEDFALLEITQFYDDDAVCVMIEANSYRYPHMGDQLLGICKANKKLNNIIFLNKQFSPKELAHLSDCEHFDVILALNIFEQFGNHWQEAVDAILN